MMENKDTAVKVAVRIRPLSEYEEIQDSSYCVTANNNENQVCFTGRSSLGVFELSFFRIHADKSRSRHLLYIRQCIWTGNSTIRYI
jgi:hypothetical protein